MKLTRAEWRIWFIFWNLLVVFAGVFAIYYIECRINMPSRELARTAAADIAGAADIGDGLRDPEQYLGYSVFFEDVRGIHPMRVYYGQREIAFAERLGGYHRFYEAQKVFYTVSCQLRPAGMMSIAGTPALRDGVCIGTVYVTRMLDYALTGCFWYALTSTVVCWLVACTILTQRRSRDVVEQIYHQYIANISHELKSPIASISAITETLSEGLVEDEFTTSRYYGIILREAKLLEHSVMQIIDLSKLQDQRFTYDKAWISPQDLFEPIRERFLSRCEEIGISFAIDQTIWALPTLYTDAFRLTQLLEILLDNACKFVEDAGHIFLNATTKFGRATIRVNDDGRGISEEDLPHVFERFYKTNINNPTGTGLGLAIAREIADGLGEEIWVQSTEGEGTIFFVTVATK